MYVVEEKDLIGDIDGMPIEIVQFMVDEQVRQGNPADVSVFQENRKAMTYRGGFDWDACEFFNEKELSSMLLKGNYRIFFEKFLKQKTEELPLPRMVLVWDVEGSSGVERELIHIIPDTVGVENKFITKHEYTDNIGVSWRFMKELPPAKKMTLKEIEKKLGYKIEIVQHENI